MYNVLGSIWSKVGDPGKYLANQLAVRQAISPAIDRSVLGSQAEAGLEPPVSNASGLTLPVFQQYLSPSVSSDQISAHPSVAAAKSVLKAAGYVIGSDDFFHAKSGRVLSLVGHHRPVVVQ